jgi:hypothetical protein
MKKVLMFLLTLLFVTTVFGYEVRPGYTKGTTGTVIQPPPRAQVPYQPARDRALVLFVEDPGDPGFGPATKPDPVWYNLLTDLIGAGNFTWYGPTATIDEDGPPFDTLLNYELVIWNTYDDWFDATPALTVNDQNSIGDYIINGGKVWLIGQDLVWTGVSETWIEAFFYTDSINQDITYRDSIVVPLGLAETAPHTFVDTTDYQSNGFFCDQLIPATYGHSIVSLSDYGMDVGVAYPNTLPLYTSFWTVDGRLATPRSEWTEMVHDMLVAFWLTGVEEQTGAGLPARTGFSAGIKNPVMGTALVKYAVAKAGPVALRVFDRTGRLVTTLIDEYKAAGTYTVRWTTDGVENGIYFLRLDAAGETVQQKLVVIQ